MTIWISTIIVGFVTTFLYRGGFILFKRASDFPKIIEDFLDYVPIAAMFAIASANIIFAHNGNSLDFAPDKTIAGILAFIAAYLSRNLFITLLVGMISLWVLHYLEAFVF